MVRPERLGAVHKAGGELSANGQEQRLQELSPSIWIKQTETTV